MKKVIFLITFALLFSLIAPISGYAETDAAKQEKAGNLLKEMEIIKGSGSGLATEAMVTREQAMIILARLMGQADKAEAFAYLPIFSDVAAGQYYSSQVCYAYSMGWTKGIGDGKFGTGMKVGIKSVMTMFLNALGYPSDWNKNDIMGDSEKLGLLKGIAVGSDPNRFLNRGEIFVMLLNALSTKPSGKEQILAQELKLEHKYFADKTVPSTTQAADTTTKAADKTSAAAKTTKPKETKPAGPKPVAASTYLYDDLKITFSEPVKAVKSNFVIKEGSRTIPEDKWTLSHSGNDLTFKFKNQHLHGKTINVEVSGVVSANKKVPMSTKYNIQATFKDYYDLVVVSQQAVSEKECKIKFTVPVLRIRKENMTISVDGQTVPDSAYSFSHFGADLKIVFNKGHYPKKDVAITYNGLETSSYRKLMTEAKTVTIDFTDFSVVETPYVLDETVPPAVITAEKEPAPATTTTAKATTTKATAVTTSAPATTTADKCAGVEAPKYQNVAVDNQNQTAVLRFKGVIAPVTKANFKVFLETGEQTDKFTVTTKIYEGEKLSDITIKLEQVYKAGIKIEYKDIADKECPNAKANGTINIKQIDIPIY